MRIHSVKSEEADLARYAGRGTLRARLFFSLALFGLAGCSGGGTTGHEDLDVRTPPLAEAGPDTAVSVPDATAGEETAIEAGPPDVTTTIDARPDLNVVDAGAPDLSSPMDAASDAIDVSTDVQRVRDGAVVRDTPLPDPDAAPEGGSIEGGVDAGPPTVCGDGKKEGKEQCDDGNVISGDGCSAICTDTKACDMCITENCAPLYDPPAWPLCSGITGNAMSGEAVGRPRKELCQETYACLLRSDCVDWKNGNPTSCYCGTIDTSDCLGGKPPNGACRKEIDNGMETTDVSFLLTQMTSPNYAAGAAISIRVCAFDLCHDQCGGSAGGDGGVDGGDSGGAPESGVSDAPNSQ